MKCIKKDNLIIIRLFPDENIIEEIKNVCKKYKVKTAVVISGLGQLKFFQLGYFKEKGDYIPEEFNIPHELVSLTGNIVSQKDDYLLHLHAVLSDEHKKAIGGHLIQGIVEVTGEIILLNSSISLRREFDEKTGLNLISLE